MKRAVALGAVALVGLVLAPSFACGPVVGTPLSEAPMNACGPDQFPCDRYVVTGKAAKAQCNIDESTRRSRCDVGRPDYPFRMVVNLPDSSYYAPGRSLVITSNALTPQPGITTKCPGIPGTTQCVRVPKLVTVEGTYRVSEKAAATLGLPLDDRPSIPLRVQYVPIAPDSNNAEAAAQGLPLGAVATSTRAISADPLPPEIKYLDTVSVGRHLRVAYPQPPFDAFFPPVFTPLTVTENLRDGVVLGLLSDAQTTPLDDENGSARTTTITRREGLEGWRVWLIDAVTRRRISTIKALAGLKQTVTLHTVGWNQPGTTSLLPAFIIVAPPEGWLAVPRLESAIINGAGFEELEVPALPPPATLTGVVAHGGADGGVLTGIPSRLLFTSNGLLRYDLESKTFLKYETAVSTDEAGHFATVLPPGYYDVTIEPAEGTGFSKVKQTLDTTATRAKTFDPPARSIAFGHVVLADGRPLSEADVSAVPSDAQLDGRAVRPRPARARTDREGNFRFEVDQGQFYLMVDPQPGTDFPRVVQVRNFGTGTIDVGEIVVAPPARFAVVLRDPSDFGNPIVRAMVRVFAEIPGRGPPDIEIGRGLTGDDGRVEILLAQQAR